jgi:hypothetical protein
MKFEHYAHCQPCSEKMGGKLSEGCITVWSGECPVCKEFPVTLIPWVDFNWPKDIKTDKIAKLNRD